MDAELRRVTFRFRRPITTAYGTLTERVVVVLRLRDEAGHEGLGEAAPLPGYRDESVTETAEGLPAVALDTARADCAARAQGRPLAELGPRPPVRSVPVNAAIVATHPDDAAREAASAVEAGFGTVKLKVGLDGDAARVAAVRAAAGPDVAIRVDANGAWDVDEAVATLRGLAESGIELCEEPVHGVRRLAAVRERLDGAVAIAMDETASDDGAVASGATDFVCLKVAACGGITRLWQAAERAWAAGARVYVSSTYDGPVGIAAGLHAAAALGPDPPACGLATLSLFDGVEDPLPPRDGRMDLPRGPGLGITWPAG
jgi:L-Ala-D/L-Glu epimerase